jgi:hypothetical protein
MKCAVAFSVLFAGSVLLLGESRTPPVLDEIVRMTKSGASDVAVLAYARAHRLELPEELSVAALQWLRSTGVSERVVSYMSAIDVRASSLQTVAAAEGVTYAGGEQPGRPAPRNSAELSWDDHAAQMSDGNHGSSGSEAYASHESGFGNDDLYPYWGYTYPGPYYVYPSVAIEQGNPFQPAHGHRGDHPGHHGQPGHHRSDGWRDRGAGRGHSSGSTFAATRRAPGNAAASRGFRASSPSPSMTTGRTPPTMRGPRNGSTGVSPRAPVVAHGGGGARSGAGMSAPAGGRGRH